MSERANKLFAAVNIPSTDWKRETPLAMSLIHFLFLDPLLLPTPVTLFCSGTSRPHSGPHKAGLSSLDAFPASRTRSFGVAERSTSAASAASCASGHVIT